MSGDPGGSRGIRVLRLLLRGAALVLGAVVLLPAGWAIAGFYHLTLAGFSTDATGTLDNADFIGAMFTLWLLLWPLGVMFLLLGSGRHRARVAWVLAPLSGILLVAAFVTYVIGARPG